MRPLSSLLNINVSIGWRSTPHPRKVVLYLYERIFSSMLNSSGSPKFSLHYIEIAIPRALMGVIHLFHYDGFDWWDFGKYLTWFGSYYLRNWLWFYRSHQILGLGFIGRLPSDFSNNNNNINLFTDIANMSILKYICGCHEEFEKLCRFNDNWWCKVNLTFFQVKKKIFTFLQKR